MSPSLLDSPIVSRVQVSISGRTWTCSLQALVFLAQSGKILINLIDQKIFYGNGKTKECCMPCMTQRFFAGDHKEQETYKCKKFRISPVQAEFFYEGWRRNLALSSRSTESCSIHKRQKKLDRTARYIYSSWTSGKVLFIEQEQDSYWMSRRIACDTLCIRCIYT